MGYSITPERPDPPCSPQALAVREMSWARLGGPQAAQLTPIGGDCDRAVTHRCTVQDRSWTVQ
jgi:hypothetical protein